MKLAMNEVSFEGGGTVVHMRKGPASDVRAELQADNASASDTQATNLRQGVSVVAADTNAFVGQPQAMSLKAAITIWREKDKRHAIQRCGD
jgi:hypothetical protein